MKIVLLYNKTRRKCLETMIYMAEQLQKKDIALHYSGGMPGFSLEEAQGVDFSSCDMGIVLGGDGTLLEAVKVLAPLNIPLFGINLGRVGFLSSAESSDANAVVEKIADHDYSICECILLKAMVYSQEAPVTEYLAFNDYVVGTGVSSRAITFDLAIDDQPINSYNADGVIIATPSGSTGYSLSAGGPILMDNTDITLITPVCPHTFFSRPIVADAASKVQITCNSKSSLTVDGQKLLPLECGSVVSITEADIKAKIIKFSANDYFDRIKNKLYKI